MEKKLKERLERLGGQILISSRNELYLSMRFFEQALFHFSYELSLSTQLLGTDGETLYYNPKHLLELYEKSPVKVNKAYLHILLHCLFRHLFKEEQEELLKEDQQEAYRDYTIWDLSCDIAIESVIDSLEGFSCVLTEQSNYREEIYGKLKDSLSVLTAEGIYLKLKTMDIEMEYERLRREFQIDDHNFWKNKKEEDRQQEEKRQDKNRQQQTAWEEMAKKTQTAMETVYHQIGDRAGSLKVMLKIQNRHRDDYQQFLRQFAAVKEEIQLDLDSFDYIPYCFGLSGYGKDRACHIPLIEPLEYKERCGIDEFAIAIDTSGSISKEQIEEFLAETVQILQSEETFFRKVNIHILQCDAKLQKKLVLKSKEDWQLLMDMDNIEVSGFGGTDFRPVFSYLEESLKQGIFTRLRGLLYFTDGFGTYPETMPSPLFETVFVLPVDSLAAAEPPVPCWAAKLFIDFHKEKKKGEFYEY